MNCCRTNYAKCNKTAYCVRDYLGLLFDLTEFSSYDTLHLLEPVIFTIKILWVPVKFGWSIIILSKNPVSLQFFSIFSHTWLCILVYSPHPIYIKISIRWVLLNVAIIYFYIFYLKFGVPDKTSTGNARNSIFIN